MVKPRSTVKPDLPSPRIKHPARTCSQQFSFFLFSASRGQHFPPSLEGAPSDHYQAFCQHHSVWPQSFFPQGSSLPLRPHQDPPGDANCCREQLWGTSHLRNWLGHLGFPRQHTDEHTKGWVSQCLPTGTPRAWLYLFPLPVKQSTQSATSTPRPSQDACLNPGPRRLSQRVLKWLFSSCPISWMEKNRVSLWDGCLAPYSLELDSVSRTGFSRKLTPMCYKGGHFDRTTEMPKQPQGFWTLLWFWTFWGTTLLLIGIFWGFFL